MGKTVWCILINDVTCRNAWHKWEVLLAKHDISTIAKHSCSLEDARTIIQDWFDHGHRHFLLAGGDGTVHHGGNLLLDISGERSKEITFGVLPCGTGNDWVRTYGSDSAELMQNIKDEVTSPANIIEMRWPDGRVRYAMNMVGGALDASVVKKLGRPFFKIPSILLYPYGLIKALIAPHTWPAVITWEEGQYKGDVLTIQAGFGHYCGGGMYVLPHAKADAPGFLIMKPKSLFKILRQTPSIYNGRLIQQQEAVYGFFETMSIDHFDKPIPVEADGEYQGETPVSLVAKRGVMRRVGGKEREGKR